MLATRERSVQALGEAVEEGSNTSWFVGARTYRADVVGIRKSSFQKIVEKGLAQIGNAHLEP